MFVSSFSSGRLKCAFHNIMIFNSLFKKECKYTVFLIPELAFSKIHHGRLWYRVSAKPRTILTIHGNQEFIVGGGSYHMLFDKFHRFFWFHISQMISKYKHSLNNGIIQ